MSTLNYPSSQRLRVRAPTTSRKPAVRKNEPLSPSDILTLDAINALISNPERWQELLMSTTGRWRSSPDPISSVTRPPRPRNPFILFRSAYIQMRKSLRFDSIYESPSQQNLSKDAARVWNGAPDHLKNFFALHAEIEKEEHQRKFPSYRFKQSKNRSRKDRNVHQVEPQFPVPPSPPKTPADAGHPVFCGDNVLSPLSTSSGSRSLSPLDPPLGGPFPSVPLHRWASAVLPLPQRENIPLDSYYPLMAMPPNMEYDTSYIASIPESLQCPVPPSFSLPAFWETTAILPELTLSWPPAFEGSLL